MHFNSSVRKRERERERANEKVVPKKVSCRMEEEEKRVRRRISDAAKPLKIIYLNGVVSVSIVT